MPDLTPKQRITLSAIDAAGNIAEAAQAIAHALTEAASVLRQITSPYGSEPCHGDCGWPPEEDLVDDEAPEEGVQSAPQNPEDQPQDTTAWFRAFVARQTAAKPELPIERPLDVERSDAGFTGGPVWVGGPGVYEGRHVYWSERDRSITHTMLMDACKGLSLAGRREAHVRASAASENRPTVTDLYKALLERKSIEMAAYAASFGPEQSDAADFDDLREIPEHTSFDASDEERKASAEFFEAVKEIAPHGSVLIAPCPDTMAQIRAFVEAHEAVATVAAEQRSLLDAVEALEGTAPTTGPSPYGKSWDEAGEAQDGPNAAEPSMSADASNEGCAASSAVPRATLETAYGDDLDRIATEQFDVTRSSGETDSSLRAFLMAKRDAVHELASDVVEVERLGRAADLSPEVWGGVGGSQTVEVGVGRFNAVDISDPIKD